METGLLIFSLAIIIPVILFMLLLFIEGLFSGWSIELDQWEDLPIGGQLIDNK